jgi:2-oxoglutarate ferredoxin oxidoreductase subunit delta
VRGFVTIDESLCKGCALCTGTCPKGLLHMATDRFTARGHRPVVYLDPQAACTGCVLCATICPEAAIAVYRAARAA